MIIFSAYHGCFHLSSNQQSLAIQLQTMLKSKVSAKPPMPSLPKPRLLWRFSKTGNCLTAGIQFGVASLGRACRRNASRNRRLEPKEDAFKENSAGCQSPGAAHLIELTPTKKMSPIMSSTNSNSFWRQKVILGCRILV